MSFFGQWIQYIDPIITRALSILPHLREIINIAFKPFNRINLLDDHDRTHLANRIRFIESKLSLIGEEKANIEILDKNTRKMIIVFYSEKLKQLERKMIREFMLPVFTHLTNPGMSLFDIKQNNFYNFYSEELEESMMLPEKEFSIPPLKRSILRTLENGLDYLMRNHPRRSATTLNRIDYLKSVEKRGEKQEIHGVEHISNYQAVDSVGFCTYLWNEIGAVKNIFLNQFLYLGVDSSYVILFPHGCFSILEKHSMNSMILEEIFDKVIIELCLSIKILQSTDTYNNTLIEFFYPSRPISSKIQKIRDLEKQTKNKYHSVNF
nr:MAG: 37 kDa protein [Ophiovirus lactucae]